MVRQGVAKRQRSSSDSPQTLDGKHIAVFGMRRAMDLTGGVRVQPGIER
jgi:hypothetical protein